MLDGRALEGLLNDAPEPVTVPAAPAPGQSLAFAMLGPVQVVCGTRAIDLGPTKVRALLALLLLRANELVSRDALIDGLWGEQPPATAGHSLSVYVSQLRKKLRGRDEACELLTQPGGYVFRVDPERIDARRFERLSTEGKGALAAGDPATAAVRLRCALALWHGPALADLAFEPFASLEAARLEELRLEALEARIEADLHLGREGELIGELEVLVAKHPLREHVIGLLMRALYRAERQAEALEVFRRARSSLVDELGIEPGRELRQLQQSILSHAPELDPPRDGAENGSLPSAPTALEGPPPVVRRKVVSVFFCDLAGSAPADPEALQPLLGRYLEHTTRIVERHGGAVSKFIGDTVMAVFGVPAAHEDDALRACRAAVELRDAFTALGIEGRIGLNTGEVMTGTEERLAIGDAVNVAARLLQAAAPNEVFVGAPTLELAAGAVEVERVEPLIVKGKREPVPAWRLLAVRSLEERHEARFVGREGELALIQAAWERAQGEEGCELLTIVGEAGIGKSRLVAEALTALSVRTVQGRCLSYGEGITYWPVVEVLTQLGALPADPAAAAALRSLLRESDEATSAEEIAWAFRKLLEEQAPLVVVFDDVHSGEETFLDLVEGVALLASGAPILLLCLARPELLGRRSEWPVALRLEPLSDEHVEGLIGERVSEGVRAKIVRAAGGNPLFVLEMLAMATQAPDRVVVPPSLRALLTARLDQLDEPERRLLERAAVEGEVFHRGAVQALTPEESQLTPRLAALARKELIRPDRAHITGEDGFRFRHLLVRDAAYDALPKASRAELHERFAGWLEERGAGLVELDELLGHHLDQAIRYRQELGLPDDDELRASARRRLAAAGRRANLRQDYGAAASLLERAAALAPPGETDVPLEIDLVDALFWGRRGREALRRAGGIAERAAVAGDRVGELCGRLQEGVVLDWLEPEGATERLAALVEEALPVFEAAADDLALYLAYRARGQVAHVRGQMDRLTDAYDRAAAHAERAGLADRLVLWRCTGRFHGTRPLSELLAWQDGLEERERRSPWVPGIRAWAVAMLGRFDEARALLAEPAERGAWTGLASQIDIGVELLAGDPAAAVAIGEENCRLLDELGQGSALAVIGGFLARAYYEQGRLEKADAWAGRVAAVAAPDRVFAQMLWRQVRAKVCARRGRPAEAERLAREAVAIADTTEMPNWQADVYADLAEVLSLAGRAQEAADALEQALARYERKENLVMAARIRTRLAGIATVGTS
jgi:DNA-binding SARP family transcriptional activator/class 3 adenylate cyclase/tetratricopeptide (TPR) repeat protein